MPKGMEHTKAEKPTAETTFEANSYLGGLFHEFQKQTQNYALLTGQLLSLEARIELSEKTLCLTRDHLAMMIERTETARPHDWDSLLKSVRFVGIRLGDACITLLKERNKLTNEELLSGLNKGMYRFHTNSPFREIHAALLRHPSAKKVGQTWVWTGTTEQMPLRLRVAKRPTIEQDMTREGTTDSLGKGI